ncbi:holothin acyltransferase-like [Saccoglossus kowalevskii]|uniref:Uncharacterized protein LOC102807234 n=1 Tax=Saccoglossus kowalevskii TaxID=10224 RepID=A0ABM0MLX1_SACKO|nr:PREDICTED: uncharacterized protein LOC102807234 [Saccoglossus kowalevskii]
MLVAHLIRYSLRRFTWKTFLPKRHLCSSVRVAPMPLAEVMSILPQAAREGSSPTPYESQTVSMCNDGGLFVAVGNTGQVIGTVSAMKYSESLGHIGYYYIDPDYRGKEVEEQLWQKAVGYLGNQCNIGIDIKPSQLEELKKKGFTESWRNCRYKGLGSSLLAEFINTEHIRPLTRLSLNDMVEYDCKVSTVERRLLIQRWSNTPKPGGAYAAIKEGRILGYGVIRPCIEGFLIGPLYADNTALTQALLLTLFALVPNADIYIDSPIDNPSFIHLLTKDMQMEPVFETVRMYSKGNPGIPLQKMFALSGIELG